MKLSTGLMLAAVVGIGSVATVQAGERTDATRVFPGGRNAPGFVTLAPAKETQLAKRPTKNRKEILAGGRNAPQQAAQPAERFQVAPAVRK